MPWLQWPAWLKILLSLLVIFLRRVFLSARKLGQCRRKWLVFSTSPSRKLVKYLIHFRLFKLNMLFAVGLIDFKYHFWKYCIKAWSIWNFMVQFIPVNDGWRKKRIFEEAVFNFKMRNIICIPSRVIAPGRKLSRFLKMGWGGGEGGEGG